MTIDLSTAFDRIVENEVAALNALTPAMPSDAVPYFVHYQESFPYWTNRVGPMTMDDEGEELDKPSYTIIMRLTIAHLTDNYDGANEALLKTWIPQVVSYFHARPRLQTTTYNTGLSRLDEARIISCTGLRVLNSIGIPVTQIGTEFTLRLTFIDLIDLAYG